MFTGETFPSSCFTSSFNTSGVYRIQVPHLGSFPVYCDNDAAGFGWLVIQRRLNGSLNFYRNWQEYRDGFGDLNGEFFIGLEKLRAITALEPSELYITLEDFEGQTRYAKFEEFAIGREEDGYAMIALGAYKGNAGDSLRSHYKMKFSTYDRDNDHKFGENCAFLHVGAWWYNGCLDRYEITLQILKYTSVLNCFFQQSQRTIHCRRQLRGEDVCSRHVLESLAWPQLWL